MLISKSGRLVLPSLVTLTIATLLAAGCGSSYTSTSTNSQTVTGSSFVVGTDAPMASVVSFNVHVSIAATDANGNTVQLTSGSPMVDFARFNGLQTLIDMNDVPVGTYSSRCHLVEQRHHRLPRHHDSRADHQDHDGKFITTQTITYTLSKPMIVAQSGAPVGLHMDFNLRKSIGVSGGQITGDVNPTFTVNGVNNNDKGAYIDEFDAAVVNTDAGKQTITIQGPHGRQFTVNVTARRNGTEETPSRPQLQYHHAGLRLPRSR